MINRRSVTGFLAATGLALLAITPNAWADAADAAVGRWTTIDDNSHEARSIVRLYVQDGKLVGLIERILNKEHENDRCTKCTGKNKDRRIQGMVFVWGLQRDGDGWSGGQIFDPEKGETYGCNITPEGNGRLKVRGYLGISLLGRTQYWLRAKDGT